MPASKRMDDLTEHREKSDRLQLLNGNWKFRYFESIYDVKESFYETDYDVSDFDEMRVPGIWQMAVSYTHLDVYKRQQVTRFASSSSVSNNCESNNSICAMV